MPRESPLPDLAGRTCVVVGADTVLGAQTARCLVRRNATVVLVSPRLEPVATLLTQLDAVRPHADVFFERLSPHDLAQVPDLASRMRARYDQLHAVVLTHPVSVAAPVAARLAASQPAFFAFATTLAAVPGRLARVVVATSLERPEGSRPSPATVHRVAEQCAAANTLFRGALARSLAPEVRVVACRPTFALREGRRSGAAQREADAVVRALVDPDPDPRRLWQAARGWPFGRVGAGRAPRHDRRQVARLGAWLRSETGIAGVTTG